MSEELKEVRGKAKWHSGGGDLPTEGTASAEVLMLETWLGSPKKSSDDNVVRKQQNENQKIKEKGKSGGGEIGKVAGEIGWGVCRALNVILRTLIFHSE